MARIFIKRGTRAQLDNAATAGQLAAGELYLITDEARLAVGLSANSYQALAKDSEAGGSLNNAGVIPWPKSVNTPRIVGDVGGTALTTLNLTPQRQYFIPFTVPRVLALTGLRIEITLAAAGEASVGIYDNNAASMFGDGPGNLLVSAGGLNTSTIGIKVAQLSITLNPGSIYWASLISSSNPSVRALAAASMQTSLGRLVGLPDAVLYLFSTNNDYALSNPAPSFFNHGISKCPAIYLLE